MEYFYETFITNIANNKAEHKDTCCRYEDAHQEMVKYGMLWRYTKVFKGDDCIVTLQNEEDWEEWRQTLERNAAWRPGVGKKNEELVIAMSGHALPTQERHQFVEDDGFRDAKPLEVEKKENPFELGIFTADAPAGLVERKIFETPINILQDKIDPPHYQNYLTHQLPVTKINVELQWLETMCRIQRYRDNPEQFVAALELQVRKYLDRNGRKDDDLQELQKGLWYYKFMVAYIKNGCKPIYIRDIDSILARK
jgi:hypothetical protein